MAEGLRGSVTIAVDGDWDIQDLLALSESMSESYGLFYPLVATDEETRGRLQDLLRKQFWSGDIETRHFGRYIYRSIPRDVSLRIKSFHYSSPGSIEFVGHLGALLLLSRVAVSRVGLTTFRPPFTPTTFGVFAGQSRRAARCNSPSPGARKITNLGPKENLRGGYA
jgi:hypothetical protein